MSASVAAALAHELARLDQTYEEAIAGLDPVPDPAILVKVLKAWNDLTPAQRMAWEGAAVQVDLCEQGHTPTN